jgi:signal transduction histidine kinase
VPDKALQQPEKLAAIGQFVSSIAHELNNPLAAILLFAEDLLEVDRPDEEREALAIIAQQARRSRSIVRDLLAFVRSRDIVRTEVCPQTLLDQISRTLHPQLDALGVRHVVEVTALERIHVDAAGIEQVVTNLVMNAAQAMGPGGIVWTRAYPESTGYAIEVADSGPGIPADILPKIFEPFFTTKALGQGTGLGLAVSLGIVQQHGGTITACNRDASEGGGARFVVRVPAPARALPVEERGDSILVA